MKAPLRKINHLRNIKEAVSRTVFDNELIGMECKTEEVTKVTVPENARDDRRTELMPSGFQTLQNTYHVEPEWLSILEVFGRDLGISYSW